MHYDYTTIGHVTIDLLADGTRRPGGGAFYSALQAARLGLRVLVITQGVEREIVELLEPYRGELALEVLPAAQTTTLGTNGTGPGRSQRVLAWAGPIDRAVTIDTGILHLAPVARETPSGWDGVARFVGLTPQGLARTWDDDGLVSLGGIQAGGERIAEACDAVVLNERERAVCTELIRVASGAGATVAITDEGGPNHLLLPDGESVRVMVPELAERLDDLGAGDVYAAAFFCALAGGADPAVAARLGNAAAAIRMAGPGPGGVGHGPEIRARAAADPGSQPPTA